VSQKKVLFTIFGATGDLAKRKLYPSLFHLFQKGELHENFAVIGTARRPWSDDYYQEVVLDSIKDIDATIQEAKEFASHFYYQSHDVQDTQHYVNLKELGDKLQEKYQIKGNQVFYLAMAPQFFGMISKHLKSQGILTGQGFERVIIEKPFGTSFDTAAKLNDELQEVFPEQDIFRIDHYLGKEMIQNVSAIRFANQMFESLWNSNHIDNIQITFAESLGVEDRGGYYETSGALKDMVQNHILQVLSLLAMEPPTKFTEEDIRAEKIKALRAVRQYSLEEAKENFIRGQYTNGHLGNDTFVAYTDEPNIAPDSKVETFVAGKFFIDNFRWHGVPFYVRTGKRLTEKGTRINVVFKQTPYDMFGQGTSEKLQDNVLTIYIQPTEGFSLTLNGKEVGHNFAIEPLKLDYRHDAQFAGNSPEAYERLILDTLEGDATNFSHWKEVARSWELVDVIREAWDNDEQPVPKYEAGTMGPQEAFDLLEKSNRHWVWMPDRWYRERGLL
jgi:glucose-6-phosphate 1-dehydrogenase